MKRPIGVTILAVVIFLYGLLVTGLCLFVLIFAAVYHTSTVVSEIGTVVERLSVISQIQIAAQLALGVFALVSGVGMLRLQPWAWLMGMLLLGCELAIQLGNYFQGHPAYLALFITALLVFYLNQRPIREVFSIEPKSSATPTSIHIESVGSADAVEPPGTMEP